MWVLGHAGSMLFSDEYYPNGPNIYTKTCHAFLESNNILLLVVVKTSVLQRNSFTSIFLLLLNHVCKFFSL